jgi:flagellar hook-associated protein 2
MSTTSIGGGGSQLDQLVNQLIAIERRPVINMEASKSEMKVRKAIFSDLASKLSTLKNRAKKLADTVASTSVFNNKTVTSNTTGVVTGTATSAASNGTHTLFVTQLARQSTQVSDQFTSAATSLVSAVGTGQHTFNVTVNGVTTAVNVTVADGEDDKTILNNMALAINDAMAEVDDSVTATAIDDSSTTSRLTITSKKTGLAYKVALADVSGTLIASTGVGSTSASTDTTGGYIHADATLDAKFKLNGVNITRSSNTVSDALTGVTLNLKATQTVGDADVTLTIGADTTTIRSEIDGFIKDYNDALKYLNLKTAASSTSRGELSADYTFRNLINQMRSIIASGVSGVDPEKDRLTILGITIARDGTLSVGDTSKLDDAIGDGSLKSLFNTASSGLGNQLDSLINGFVVTGGILSGHQSLLDTRIKTIENQIKTFDERITRRAQVIRNQYAAAQESILLLRGQASSFGLFSSQIG